jgi:hypothetical protein
MLVSKCSVSLWNLLVLYHQHEFHFYPFYPCKLVWYLQCRTNLCFTFDASDAASNKRCVGKIKCAFLEMINLLLISKLNFSRPSISLLKTTGSITTPFPITFTAVLWKIPEGIVLRTCFIPSNSKVCPAFGPPWKRAIISYFEVSTSTIFLFLHLPL